MSSPLLALVIGACGAPQSVAPDTSIRPDASVSTLDPKLSIDRLEGGHNRWAEHVDRTTPDDAVRALAQRHNAFGLDLWKALAGKHAGNLALSPASIAAAFGMTFAGAKNATADVMRKVLHLEGIADPHTPAGKTLSIWNAPGKSYALRVANQLFGEQTARFEKPFLDLLLQAFVAPLEPLDFLTRSEDARVRVNTWVAGQTEDKIKDLLPPGAVDSDTRLVLVNAIYFKGQWKSRFDKAQTKDGAFHAPGGDIQVPLMRQTGAFAMAADETARLLELPYVGDDLVMDIVLPNGDVADFDPARLDAMTSALAPVHSLSVTLPRFRIATESLALSEPLTAMGMGAAFLPSADFTGMSPEKPLFIKEAFHKVFVEVNEEGTEAAAATAVVMTRESASLPVEFTVDKPFMFFIRDLRTGHVVFMGRVTNPKA